MGDAPESHKVKVAAAEARAAADKATTEAAQVERRTARRGMYKRAAQYQAEYASIDKSLIRQIHLGVFLRVNKATQEMIKRVEPYVAYGYPSLKATRELIYKRGFGKKKTMGQAQRVTLNCNDDIEVALGDHGINCFEDLIHEIYTVGPAFKQANNFLWPFKLNSAKGGLPKKRLGFNEGGQCGNREQYMSSLIFRML